MHLDPQSFRDIDPGSRVLMGPGPSDVPARILQAMSAPCIGHLDPYFLALMDETQRLLRFLFQTENELTIPVSGTGSAGMEACFVNLDFEWGRAVDPEAVRSAIQGKAPKLVAVVHAETSTGVCTPLEDLSKIAHDAGALFLVDAVTSLAGLEVAVDKRGIDAVYSGTQKCLSCPPGLSPISLSPAALKTLESRKTPVVSWYLDMSMVRNYWGGDRKYHHTAPINMIYALREALRIVAEEGLEARFARHRLNHLALVAGIEAMGLSMLVPEAERLPMLNAVRIPEGANDAKVRGSLLQQFGIEIGGGLGDLAGKVWRVGLMGHASSARNVCLFLAALETVLRDGGVKVGAGALEAAAQVYTR
jgi:alanine-glyoxylate transaminase/serine-glyoxylate transaminase/serine-pyruvate transaminase